MSSRYMLLFQILTIFTVVGSVILAFLILLFASWKSRFIWSSPRCAGNRGRCGYDLRGYEKFKQKHCPECGSDLSHPHIIEFVQRKFNYRLLFVAFLSLLIPLTIWGSIFWVIYNKANQPSPWNLQRYPLATIEQFAKANPKPHYTYEIVSACETHLKDPTITSEDAQKAFDIINYCLSDPNLADRMDHNIDNFIQTASNHPLVTDDMMLNLQRTWFGKNWRAQLAQRFYTSDPKLHIRIKATPHDHPNDWPRGTTNKYLLKHIKEVRLDGKKVKHHSWSQNQRYPIELTINAPNTSPGQHALEIDAERAIFTDDEKPYEQYYSRKDWPSNPLWHEEKTLKLNIRCYRDTAEAIPFIHDKSLTQKLDNQIEITSCIARKFNNKTRLILTLKRTQSQINQLYELQTELGILPLSKEKDFFTDPTFVNLQAHTTIQGKPLILEIQQESHSQNTEGERNLIRTEIFTLTADLDKIPPDINSLDFVLTGNREQAKHSLEINQVWQGKIHRKAVKLQRWDLGQNLPFPVHQAYIPTNNAATTATTNPEGVTHD